MDLESIHGIEFFGQILKRFLDVKDVCMFEKKSPIWKTFTDLIFFYGFNRWRKVCVFEKVCRCEKGLMNLENEKWKNQTKTCPQKH